MACDCITVMDEKLMEHNSRLQVTFTFGGDGALRAYIGTEKINKRSRDHCGSIASHCPFCGSAYAKEADAS